MCSKSGTNSAFACSVYSCCRGSVGRYTLCPTIRVEALVYGHFAFSYPSPSFVGTWSISCRIFVLLFVELIPLIIVCWQMDNRGHQSGSTYRKYGTWIAFLGNEYGVRRSLMNNALMLCRRTSSGCIPNAVRWHTSTKQPFDTDSPSPQKALDALQYDTLANTLKDWDRQKWTPIVPL